jgi:nicotinamide-nucleotide amidase
MTAHLITIGDEILIGQIIDTNSAWMAQQLNLQGIRVNEILSISDDKQHILTTLAHSEKLADVVLITGGLGPTKDDITKKTLCEYYDTDLVFNEEVWAHIVRLFAKFGRTPKDVQRGQAEQPRAATILPNKVGTASGMWFERNGTVIISMPGVPFEMQYLMENEVLPRLKSRAQGLPIAHRTVLTACIGESDLAEMVADFEADLPAFAKLAYLPALSQVRLRLTAQHTDEAFLNDFLDKKQAEMVALVAPHVFGYEKQRLQSVVGDLLKAQNQTLATAESCTGGYIAHLITSIEGSSAYFQGSVVAYDNAVKTNILGVPTSVLETEGAVSEACVRAMAEGAKRLFKVDFAVSVSGIAGPSGGSEEKPVGTIWFAIATPNGTIAEKLKFGRDRSKNIELTSVYVLNALRKTIAGYLHASLTPKT